MGLPRKAEQKADKKEINFFEVSVNCENNTVRAVCYDLNRRPLLEKFNEESKSCCMLNAEKSDDDVIILDPKSLNSRFLCSQCEKETQHNNDNLFSCCLLNCKKHLLESMVGVKTTNAMFLKLFMGLEG